MPLLDLGSQAPDFTADTAGGEVALRSWLSGGWGILFSYPKAYTSVCSRELVALAKLLDEYKQAQIAIAAISGDSVDEQSGFGSKLEEENNCPATRILQFADPRLKIAESYGMVHGLISAKLAMRVTYIIDTDLRIQLVQAYPPKVERNFSELLDAAVKLRESAA